MVKHKMCISRQTWRGRSIILLILLLSICQIQPVAANGPPQPAIHVQAELLPTPLPGGEIVYIVADGDTLPIIAERFGIPLETVLILNGLSADSPLKVGQRLIIGLAGDAPQEPPTAEPQAPPPTDPPPPVATVDLYYATPTPLADGRILYTVQPGDTLVSIAVRFNLTLDQIYGASGLNQSSLLAVGQTIELGRDLGSIIPLDGNVPPRYAGATYREADNAYVHTVQTNETLIEIALQYQYETMDAFYTVSGLGPSSFISVGQAVVVGYKPVPQSQGGSTDAPTGTPLPPPPPTALPTATPLPTNTPIPFPTALPTATLSNQLAAALTAEVMTRESASFNSDENQSSAELSVAPTNFVPAFLALFGSFVVLIVLGIYLWFSRRP